VLTQDLTDVLRKKNLVIVLKIIIAKSLNSTKKRKLKILVIAASARRNRMLHALTFCSNQRPQQYRF